MVNLAQLTQAESYAQTSGNGFGTRALCRRLSQHDNAPKDMDVWLSGLRRANAFNVTTNPVPNAHMRSPGGFMETFPGMRDSGDIQFEACFKNDVPVGATAGDITAGDFQAWQAPIEADDVEKKSFFHSLFFDREPFEMWVIPPQWTRGLWVARGYASMAGPFPHELEGVVNFQASFKISGRAMMLRGVYKGTVSTAEITQAAVADTNPTLSALVDGTPANNKNRRWRAVSTDLLTEIWSARDDGGMTRASWGEAGASNTWNVYEYMEDDGFGTAF